MNKSVTHCQISGQGFSEIEIKGFKMLHGEVLCSCHSLPTIERKAFVSSDLSEKLHEMIADHNADVEKVFYYTESEVRDLCRNASNPHIPENIFNAWWENNKKK